MSVATYLDFLRRQNEAEGGSVAPADGTAPPQIFDPPRSPSLWQGESNDESGAPPSAPTAPSGFSAPMAPSRAPMSAIPLPVAPSFPRLQAPIGLPGARFPAPPILVPDWRALEALGAKAHAIIREAANSAYMQVGEMVNWAYASEGKSFQTYTKQAGDLPWLYAGRTSGRESPEENVYNRGAAGYPGPAFGLAILDRSSTSYGAIRGREQDLVNYARWCGNSANRINAISPLNPFGPYYMAQAAKEFGGPVRPGEYPCPNPQGQPPR